MSGVLEQKGKQIVFEFQILPQAIKLGTKIDEGSFGVVYQAAWSHANVAVKQLKSSGILSAEEIEEFKGEGEVMARLRHPNILQFYGYCPSPPYSIVMEYMPKSLYGLLKGGEPLGWKGSDYRGSVRYQIIIDIACGLSYLHSKEILHRDLKSRNILLDDRFRAKLGDFGLAKIKKSSRGSSVKGSGAGTLAYLAPELSEPDVHYTKRCDIYSLGITFWEVASRKEPFSDVDSTRHHLIPGWVKEGSKQEKIPDDCPKKLASLIRFCWEVKPERRPTASRIVEYLKSDEEEFKLEEKGDRGDSKSESKGDAKQDKSAIFETSVERLKTLAVSGDVNAQAQLGFVYIYGIGVSKNLKEGQVWLETAAKQGDSPASLWSQGLCYEFSLGKVKDIVKALECYRKGAEKLYAPAQNQLGFCYENGIGVAKDEREAVRLYRLSAEQGYADAQFDLGRCHQNGRGVAKDEREAVRLYRLSAEQGYAVAQFNLGVCYGNGTGIAKDEREAVRLYRLSAEQGYADAQFNLSFCYQNGTGGVTDEREAVKFFRLAANQGLADAQFSLAICYEKGIGVTKDEVEAVHFFRLAADQEHASAQCVMGLRHMKGEGVIEDRKKSEDYFKRAAKNGNIFAQEHLKRVETLNRCFVM